VIPNYSDIEVIEQCAPFLFLHHGCIQSQHVLNIQNIVNAQTMYVKEKANLLLK